MIGLVRRAAMAAAVTVVAGVGLAMVAVTPPLVLVLAIGISDASPEYPLLIWLQSLALPWLIYGTLAALAVRGVRRQLVVTALVPALLLAAAAGGVAVQLWPGAQRSAVPAARQITVAPTRK